MAIGSSPEIGVRFFRWGEMTDEERVAWFAEMRSWGLDLLGGYAVLCEPDREMRDFFTETTWTLV